MVLLPRQDWYLRLLTLFRFRLTREAIISWNNRLETVEFCLIELIESIAGGFPASLIQLYAILHRTMYESDTTFKLLGPIYVFYISIAVSVLASAWTCARLFTTNEERHCSVGFYCLLFMYYAAEKLYRMLFFCTVSLYLSSGGFKHGYNPYLLNAVFLIVSLLARFLVVQYSHQRTRFAPGSWEDSWNFLGRLLLSLATSHMWVGEYILTCRFLLLEFFEGALYFPFFVWLQRTTDFEQHHFRSFIPILVTLYFYVFKMVVLGSRLVYTPHARHVLHNHATYLFKESLAVVFAVVVMWLVLVIATVAS
jgi:hypothetical protein